MQRRDNYVTAEKVKNEFLGHSESHETILSLFQKHNDDVKQLVGISKTIATYRKYEVTRRHLAEFIQSKYNVSDISIKEISPMFITDFELYLRTACKCGYNTTAKFMQFFKRIIIIARNNGILVGDPFASYKIRLEKVDRGYLTEDEIKIILKRKWFPNGWNTSGTCSSFPVSAVWHTAMSPICGRRISKSLLTATFG